MSASVGLFCLFPAAAAFILWSRAEKQQKRKKQKERIRREFGRNPAELPQADRSRNLLEEIAIYYKETKEELTKTQIDDITWNDLEMDEIFLRINHTRSYVGEQTLYRMLRAGEISAGTPSHPSGTDSAGDRWEHHVTYFSEHSAEREKMEEALSGIGKRRADYFLPMFLRQAADLKVEHLGVYRFLQLLLLVSIPAMLILKHPACTALFLGTALVNCMIYAVSKEKYEVYLYALGSIKYLAGFGRMLTEHPQWSMLFATDELKQAAEDLKKLSHLIGNVQVKKAGVLTGDVLELLRDYIVGATLWDITVFHRIMKLIEGKQDSLFLLYAAVGRIDAAISVASFRESLPGFCIPEISENGSLKALGLYHPLLGTPVRNDFTLAKGCLITGANASGKSTFTKALAVNAILAQTIRTCAASYFSLPGLRVLTSMAVRDDILSGESYYIREISYLRRIVDAADDSAASLFLIDEILRGTNTGERLAASEAVLRYLAEKNCITVVATHDLALTDRMKDCYECYSFGSGSLKSGFAPDYIIHRGPGKSQNAIWLLSHMGFPDRIVKKAQELFRLSTG